MACAGRPLARVVVPPLRLPGLGTHHSFCCGAAYTSLGGNIFLYCHAARKRQRRRAHTRVRKCSTTAVSSAVPLFACVHAFVFACMLYFMCHECTSQCLTACWLKCALILPFTHLRDSTLVPFSDGLILLRLLLAKRHHPPIASAAALYQFLY